MSTLFYKALIEANVSETTATGAAEDPDHYKSDVTALKIKLNMLLVGVGILVALGVFDTFL